MRQADTLKTNATEDFCQAFGFSLSKFLKYEERLFTQLAIAICEKKKTAEVGFSDFRRLFTGHIKLFSHDLRFFVTAFGANAVFVERDSAERATA